MASTDERCGRIMRIREAMHKRLVVNGVVRLDMSLEEETILAQYVQMVLFDEVSDSLATLKEKL